MGIWKAANLHFDNPAYRACVAGAANCIVRIVTPREPGANARRSSRNMTKMTPKKGARSRLPSPVRGERDRQTIKGRVRSCPPRQFMPEAKAGQQGIKQAANYHQRRLAEHLLMIRLTKLRGGVDPSRVIKAAWRGSLTNLVVGVTLKSARLVTTCQRHRQSG